MILIALVLYISYITDHNSQEKLNLKNKLQKKYKNEEITYANEYNNNYILKTNNKVIVLSKDLKEIITEDLTKLKNMSNVELVYKTNKIMYEKTIRKKDEVTYEYYDALSGELVKSTKLELK